MKLSTPVRVASIRFDRVVKLILIVFSPRRVDDGDRPGVGLAIGRGVGVGVTVLGLVLGPVQS